MSRQPEVTRRELSAVLADPAVSLAAKGVLWLLLVRPPGTVLTRGELFARNADPMGAIDQAIDELARAGLAVVVPPKGRGQGRRSGGVKLPARVVRSELEPDCGPVVGARPAPAWWDVWQTPVTVLPHTEPIDWQHGRR